MKKPVDIGDIYGTWKVIAKSTEDKPYNYDYICQCECGEIKTYNKYALMNHRYGLCDCTKTKSKSKEDAIKKFKRDLEKEIIFIKSQKKYGNTTRYVVKCNKEHSFIVNGEENYKGCSKCITAKRIRVRNIKTALAGENFKNTFPYQSEFWDYNKNELKPEEVLPSSKDKFWFKCEEEHEFQLSPAVIKHRGAWCPTCCHSTESRLATYGKELFKRIFYDVKTEEEFPIKVTINEEETTLYPDVVIEDLKLNIEFHGKQHYEFTDGWHKTKSEFIRACQRDKAKKDWFLKNGYQQVVFNVTSNFDEDVKVIEDFIYNILQ